ncbi:MAG: ArsC family reductase [Methylocystaceae bacterium]|nr:ArsC family reductase [Methylocystaceae bacterium]
MVVGMINLYGIKACDTMKKARVWLDEHGQTYHFHDYKVHGVERAKLTAWVTALGWEKVLNRAGTTFRKLPPAQQQDLDASKAIELMLAQPSMIKRPILEAKGKITAGFKADEYHSLLG